MTWERREAKRRDNQSAVDNLLLLDLYSVSTADHLLSSNDTATQEESEQEVGDKRKVGSVIGRVAVVGSFRDEVDEREPGDEGPLRRKIFRDLDQHCFSLLEKQREERDSNSQRRE